MGPPPRDLGLLEAGMLLLGDAYEKQHRVADAIATREQLLALLERYEGEDSNKLCALLTSLAKLHEKAGNAKAVEGAYKRVLAIKEKADPDRLTGALTNLAKYYQGIRKYGEAEAFYLRLLALYEQEGGERDPRLKPVLVELAALAGAQGRPAHARAYKSRSAGIM